MIEGLEPRATGDFETRSAADLSDVGAWVYSLDPTTDVLCFCYRLPYWEEGRVDDWYPSFPEHGIEGTPDPVELFNWLAGGGLFEAHNAFFERSVWANQMVDKHGWPELPQGQVRCSAAKAAAHSLPRGLEMLCKALRTKHQKDAAGGKAMLKLARPRRPLKRDVEAWALEHDREEELNADWRVLASEMPTLWLFSRALFFDKLLPYCRKDVLAEEDASHQLRDLSSAETDVYVMDQVINMRGVQVDRQAIETALHLVGNEYWGLNAELIAITDGKIEKATQRARLQSWLNMRGVPILDTQGPTIDEWLKRRDLDPKAYRVLELMRALGRSSTAKYIAFQNFMDPRDDRARGMLLYHGAGTGRWSGSGPQPHNFPRGNIKNMQQAWETLHTRDVEWIETLYDDLMTVLSHALRGAIVAAPGKRLVAADYSAIEARVLFWLADEQSALDIFRRGDCIYCNMASEIYGFPVIKDVNGFERRMGKQTILGLGFQMGWKKFIETCAEYGIMIEPEFAEYVVKLYRRKYKRVARMWTDQEQAALEAVRCPGRSIRCGRILWRVVDRFLYCKLPSGRLLAYPDPIIIKKPMPWDASNLRDAISFMGVHPKTKQWVRQDTYGGTLVENIVQATARDLMADAMLRCEQTGVYEVVLSVHDELITEVPIGIGGRKELEALMAITPSWADGCPVVAEGWEGPRYKK